MSKHNDINIELIVLAFLILCFISYTLVKNKYEPQIREEININEANSKERVKEIMEKYYTSVYDKLSSTYCGELDYSDVFEVYYFKTKTFNTKEEANNYFKTFLSKKYIEDNIIKNFLEKNDKLYCWSIERSSLEYEKNSFEITKFNQTNQKIEVEGTYRTIENTLNPRESFTGYATIIKENNEWVLDSYRDIYGEETN